MKVTALVVDDEPLARRRLADLIAEVPWLSLLGEARDGHEARAAIERLRPDLCFLDVEMPGLIGTRVLAGLRHRPAVVFTTAFDRYAVEAFELRALDYLLKPFGRERFHEALDRLRERLAVRDPGALARLQDAVGAPRATLSRIFVRERGRVLPIPAGRVERLEAQDDYVAVHAAGRSHLLHLALTQLVERLDPRAFVRVHRSHAVNLAFVAEVRRLPGGGSEIRMRDGARVPVSRARRRELQARLTPAGQLTDAG